MRPETQQALMNLKRELSHEPGIHSAQITFDQVACDDYPPTVDVRYL